MTLVIIAVSTALGYSGIAKQQKFSLNASHVS